MNDDVTELVVVEVESRLEVGVSLGIIGNDDVSEMVGVEEENRLEVGVSVGITVNNDVTDSEMVGVEVENTLVDVTIGTTTQKEKVTFEMLVLLMSFSAHA